MSVEWQLILSEHGPAVWKTVRCLVGNDADARDVYQETFLQAFQFSAEADVEDWNRLLKRFGRLRSIDLLRKKYRVASKLGSTDRTAEAISLEPGPEEQFAAVELSDRLRMALTQLTSQQAEVFLMRYVEDVSYEEIAVRTHSNRNAVGALLNRARVQLQKILASVIGTQPSVQPTSEENSQ